MGNLINLPNISLDSIVVENKETKQDKQNIFDVKNYLNTRLADGETSKTVTIRLLPMDLETGNPFVLVHTHNVRVPQSMVEPGKKPYKTYICLAKNKDIDHETFGDKCPFCEINRNAYTESTKATDPVEKKNWQEISLENLSKKSIICRCIERGKENEGVKFWKFNLRDDEKDPYHTIIALTKQRSEEAAREGRVENILDIYNGYDLSVTFTAGSPVPPPTIIDAKRPSPLSADEEQMKSWIYDSMKWQDVFTCKPYEYLKLVAEKRHPWFDRANNVWVDKAEWDAEHKSKTKEIDEEIEASQTAVSSVAEAATKKISEEKNDFMSSITVNDDDMPF